MRIYHEGTEIASISDVGKNPPGGCLTRLVGINLFRQPGWLEVEPVYHSLVQLYRYERYALLFLGWSEPSWIITLQPRWPFVAIQRIQKGGAHEGPDSADGDPDHL
jgi:hypothetical protein